MDAAVPPVEADSGVTYIVTATLYSPKGRLVGRLEHSWRGPETVGNLCTILIANAQERPDMDQCRIELRWRRGRGLQSLDDTSSSGQP